MTKEKWTGWKKKKKRRDGMKGMEWSHKAAAMVPDIVATNWIVTKATD